MSYSFESSEMRDVNKFMEVIAEKEQAIILEQLGDLIKDGILVIESTRPVLIETQTARYGTQIECRKAVRLISKHQEVIDKLKEENRKLKDLLVTDERN